MQDEQFARDFNARFETFFAKQIEPVADEILTQYDNPVEVLEIDRLELDLRTLEEEYFDLHFPAAFREKLEEELIKCIYCKRNDIRKFPTGGNTDTDWSTSAKTTPVARYAFDILTYFLLHGTLPSTAYDRHRNIQELFLEALQNNSAGLKRFLFTYGHYTSLQERLVYQFGDPLRYETIRLLEPGSGEFIVSYIRLLHARYKEIGQPGIHETGYRHSVWFVVYAYLLHNTGSWFSRRNFVMQTLIQLGAKYNIAYDRLLDLITRELEQFAQSLVIDPELFGILKLLRRQLNEKQLQQSSVNGAKLYKELFSTLQQDINKGFTTESRRYLIQILSQPDLCRLFLQQLNEKEITGLVPVVLPADSDFVIGTARSLNIQKDRGGLQGKSGSEFGRIKWQVIFSVLLHEKDRSFNRRYFVASILRNIAAHYNLDWRELAGFFLNDTYLREKIGKELLLILSDLQEEITANRNTPDNTIKEDGAFLSLILQSLQEGKTLTQAEQQQLFRKIGDIRFRHSLLDKITENGHIQLIRNLFPKNKEYIISYAQKLDLLRDFNHITGKTPGGFTRVKWDFLLAVLSGLEDKSFNQLEFINSTLQQIAARYNTTKLDLLYYFRQEDVNTQIPYPLKKWLDELYTKETAFRLKGLFSQNDETEPANQAYTLSTDEAYAILSEAKTGRKKEMAGKLLLQKEFILYAKPLFRLIPSIRHFFTDEIRKELPEEQLFGFLLDLSSVYKTLSAADMMKRFIEWLQKSIPMEKRSVFYAKADEWSENHTLLSTVLQQKNDSDKNKQSNNPITNEMMETIENVFVNNAGMVLPAPFLPRLYSMLNLTEGNQFKSRDAQVKAIYAIQYAAFEKTDFPEHELVLNKILVGLDISEPIPSGVELTEEEQKTVLSMLEGVRSNWTKLKNTSIEGIRQAFLQREGKLEEKDDFYHLTVEEKAYDILLDSVPWNFRMIRHPWMKKTVQVKWR